MFFFFFFFQAEDGIRDVAVTGVQTCALPILDHEERPVRKAPAPELERLPDGPLLMIYVFALGIPSTILSAFITMSEGILYPFYAAAPRVSVLSPLEDQRLGGLLMWIPGMLIFWVAISAVWF